MIEAFSNVLFWIVVGALWWLWANEYRQYNIDRTRQRLFSIRDRLFRMAVDGDIDMHSDAHKMVRSMLQGSIRFTEHLSVFRMIRIVSIDKKIEASKEYEANMAEALKKLDSSERKVIHAALEDMNAVLIHHLVHGNLLLLIISESLRVHESAKHSVNRMMKRKLHDTRRALDASVFDIGGGIYA